MAGRPRRQAMIAELERRTRLEFDDDFEADALDYVEYRIAAGDTLKDIADSIAQATKPEDPNSATTWSVSGEMIRRYLESLHGEDATDARLARARARSSYSLSDEAKSIADNAEEDAGAVAKARMRVQQRQWAAERFNPGTFGQKTQVTGSISVAHLHLDALRATPKEVTGRVSGAPHNTALPNTVELQPVAIASVSAAQMAAGAHNEQSVNHEERGE